MAIPHVLPGQVADVAPLLEKLALERSSALFKSKDLEVMRLVLRAGESLPSHRVQGEITIHCLEGVAEVKAEGCTTLLRQSQFLYLLGDVMHSVLAIEDMSALVTIALKR